MAIIRKWNKFLLYDSSCLIDDLDLDIIEYGGHLIVDAVVRKIGDEYLFVNYDYAPIKMKLKKGEKVVIMTASSLMIFLRQQNLYCSIG